MLRDKHCSCLLYKEYARRSSLAVDSPDWNASGRAPLFALLQLITLYLLLQHLERRQDPLLLL